MNYYLRLIATGFCFAIFGLGGLAMNTFVFGPIRFMTKDPVVCRRRIKFILYQSFRFFTWLMSFVGVCDFKVQGDDKPKSDAGCIVLANHPSLIDVVVLMSLYPQANCIVKSALFKNFFLKNLLVGAGYIPSDLGEETLSYCKKAVEEGDTLVVFPEGTRSVPGQPITAKRGASQIAIRLARPIRLVHIDLNPGTLTKSEKWYQIPSKKPVFILAVGDKLEPLNFPGNGLPISVGARRLTKLVVEQLQNKRMVLGQVRN